jgi:hypothetical protein
MMIDAVNSLNQEIQYRGFDKVINEQLKIYLI